MNKKESLLQSYSDYLKMRNYSVSTYKAYMGTIRNFWSYCEARTGDADFRKADAVQSYLSYRLSVEKRDFSTVNGDYSALQWFYKYILNRSWDVKKLIRPRKEKRLPRYLSPEQVSLLVKCATSEKYRLLFLLYYATGVRLSEGRLLKWEDVVFEEGLIHIRKGKGAKDRIVVLHNELSTLLKSYRQMLPVSQVLVFAGRDYRYPIAARSVQRAFIQSRRRAGLPEWVTAHVLRHSYATSALKNQTDVLTLKTLLGHKKLATTSRYLHLDTAHFQQTHNTLSHQCLSTILEQTQQALPWVKSSENLDSLI